MGDEGFTHLGLLDELHGRLAAPVVEAALGQPDHSGLGLQLGYPGLQWCK